MTLVRRSGGAARMTGFECKVLFRPAVELALAEDTLMPDNNSAIRNTETSKCCCLVWKKATLEACVWQLMTRLLKLSATGDTRG